MNYSTIYELITIKADITPEVSAILAPGRSPINYLQVKQQIEETIGFLNNYGIGRNDRVAIVLPNGPEMALAFLSISSGATSAPLNPNYGASEFEFYLSDLNAKAVVILSGFESPVREVAQSLSIQIIDLTPKFNATEGLFEFIIASGRTSSTSSTGRAEANDIALILHTSGTTSRPKIVPLTHKNLCTSAENIRSFYRLSNNDCCLNVMPLFHIHGLIGGTLSSLAGGGSVVCTSGFDGGKFFEWIEEYHPTWYTAVPTMHQAVISQAQDYARTISNHKFRFVRSCSSALPPKVMGELENILKVPVLEAYGMTEASHQMTSNPMPPKHRKPGSVGVPTGVEVEIMDVEGSFQETGEFGEIVIRGKNVTLGYENNPDANEKAFTHGWFHTGDQGFLDEDGYLFITGRLKEIINRGGEKISPREIDEVLLEHPAVAQAVAFAVPHTTLGEDLAAAVVLKEDTAVEQIEIRKYAFEHLADFKVPSQILIVDEIPKGATGKLQRIGLHGKLESEIRGEFVPPRNEVEVAIAMIWNEVLGNEQVGVYDNFFQLGGDSLSATQLVSRLRSIFQVEIPLGSIFREPTISEQAVVIESKGEILADGKRSLIAIQLDGSKRPLFCIPGILGNVFTDLGALSEHLGSDQPFYGFQDGVHNPSKIESLAENYINEMREVQPQGPYNLAGICSGAVVAYEMANQLERYGEKVDFLAMVEPSPHRTPGLRTYILFIVGEFRRLLRRTPFQAQKISKLDLNQRFANVRLKIKKFANSLALRRYKAKIYPGQVHIFLTEETMKQQSKRRRGWIDWIQGGTQVHPIPGTHNTITGFEDTPIESNHMKVLADQFYLFMSSDNATALSTGQKRID